MTLRKSLANLARRALKTAGFRAVARKYGERLYGFRSTWASFDR